MKRTLLEYTKQISKNDTPAGDFAKDLLGDQEFQSCTTEKDQFEYIENLDLSPKVYNARVQFLEDWNNV